MQQLSGISIAIERSSETVCDAIAARRTSGRMSTATSTSVRTRCALDAFYNCGPFTALDQLGITCTDVRVTSLAIEVELDSQGILTTSQEGEQGAWCKYACAARDRHEQNLEVYMDDSAGALVRTTRPVLPGDELFVWFEESLARQRNIPILTPANIRGKDEYLCTCCGAVFQRPNPLKSHIRHYCSMQKSTPVTSDSWSPWINSNLPLFLPTPWLTPCMSALPPAVWQAASPFLLTTLSRTGNHEAMTTYTDDITGNSGVWGGVPGAGVWWLNYLQKLLHADNANQARSVKLRDVTSDAASDVTKMSGDIMMSSRRTTLLESTTMTSSQILPVRGKADRKTGSGSAGSYVCPYCGKLYSRRYGLKIHVRTHTGFKPLQCAVCRRPFGDPSNLNKHIRLHAQSTVGAGGAAGSTDAPYMCRHCGKVLVRRRDLERHVRARHADKLASPTNVTTSASQVIVTSSECVSADEGDDNDENRCARQTVDESETGT